MNSMRQSVNHILPENKKLMLFDMLESQDEFDSVANRSNSHLNRASAMSDYASSRNRTLIRPNTGTRSSFIKRKTRQDLNYNSGKEEAEKHMKE